MDDNLPRILDLDEKILKLKETQNDLETILLEKKLIKNHMALENELTTKKPPSREENQENLSFKILFLKCPIDNCPVFKLRNQCIKTHLANVHGIQTRCLASECCVRKQVNFPSA